MRDTLIGLLFSAVIGFSLAILFLPHRYIQRPIISTGQESSLQQLRGNQRQPLDKLGQRLAKAQIGLTTIHYLLLASFIGVLAYLLCVFVLQSWLLAIPAIGSGVVLTERLIHYLVVKRKERFESENIKAIRIMASSFRTSPSYIHAFEEVASSPFIAAEVSGEYQRVVKMLRGQVPVDRVMKELQERSQSDDISYLSTIIQVQRELGGDMSKTMELAALSILRKKQMQRKQRAVMSQLLAQVNLLSIMPYVFVISLYMNNPGHFEPLTATLSGRLIMLGALLLILIGGEVIRYVALRKN